MGQDVRRFLKTTGFVPFHRDAIESSIPEIFARQVRAAPDRFAVRCRRTSLTYGELDRKSSLIAHAILDRLGRGNEPVGLLFGQGDAAVAAILGALKAGKIYVAMDPAWPADDLRRVVADCRPRLILTAGEIRNLALDLAGAADRWLDVEEIRPGTRDDDPELEIAPADTCYIYYTSGSTGLPKGVYDSHRNVLHNVMRYTNSLGIGPADRLSLIQSPAFSGTVSTQFSALANGAALFPFDLHRAGIGRLADWIADEGVTIFHSVPAIFESLMATGRSFDSLRIVRLEGDRAERRQIALFQERFGDRCILVNGLGATETGLARQYFIGSKSQLPGDVVPVGYPTDDMIVRVVDDDGAEVRRDDIGEIAVTSPYLALGYWNRAEKTSEAFTTEARSESEWTYRTGDLGRMGDDGCLEVLGRKDFCPKLNGRRIDIPAIEAALHRLPAIEQAVVAVDGNGHGGQRLVAYIVASGAGPAVGAMRRALADSLPPHMIPNRYLFIDDLPLDRNAKVDRRRLPAAPSSRPKLEEPFVAARGAVEEAIAACFCEVLYIDSVGADDDFFDLGGDSLLYLELLTRIEQRFEMSTLPDIPGERFTVSTFAQSVNGGGRSTTLVPFRSGGTGPALFCMHNHPGNIPEYRRLAARLATARPVYGLQRIGAPDRGFEVLEIEDHAEIFVREICALQPDGPYHLCGNCFDGVVAFEVARQLQGLGREMGKVILVDTAFPARDPGAIGQQWRNHHFWRWFAARPFDEQLAFLGRRVRGIGNLSVRAIAGRLPGTGKQARESDADDGGGFRSNAIAAHKAALRRYRPRPYDGEITLICPGPPHNQRGWAKVADRGLCVREIPVGRDVGGRKFEMPHLTADPYLTPLAALIDEILDA
ncbi:MAG: AMP-binding protein [Alphaproteobacteria bacterium]|nr:AMP-binding protein [Alphaproteobacteria bacterium]